MNGPSQAVYLLCAITSVGCAMLLLHRYLRARTSLLLWSSVCFLGLALNNVLLFVDLVVVPQADLALIRMLTALVAVSLLVYGLVWHGR